MLTGVTSRGFYCSCASCTTSNGDVNLDGNSHLLNISLTKKSYKLKLKVSKPIKDLKDPITPQLIVIIIKETKESILTTLILINDFNLVFYQSFLIEFISTIILIKKLKRCYIFFSANSKHKIYFLN